MPTRTLAASAALCLLCLSADANPPPATVPVTDLGTLGGSASGGFGVNSKGQVAGTSQMPGDNAVHAFFYTEGKMTDLGTLGGDSSEAAALNDAGQVTGKASLKGSGKSHAFLWQQGQMKDVGTSRADDSAGTAINKAGQITGTIIRAGTYTVRACRWSGGKVDSLDVYVPYSPIADSETTAISNAGLVVGTVRKPGRHLGDGYEGTYFADHAAVWQGHKKTEMTGPKVELSLANAVNDAGQIAGAISVGPEMRMHACVWQNGKLTDLGTLADQNTVVYALNNAGVMVGGTNPTDLEANGQKFYNPGQPQHAFCCSGSELVDLNYLIDPASGWVLADAHAISDTGYVTGTGIYNGKAHAYLLKLPAKF